MFSRIKQAACGAIVTGALTLGTLGCGGARATLAAIGMDGHRGAHAHEHHDHDAGHDGMAETTNELAALAPDDRAAAAAQKTCPVTGESLGSMGTPKKVAVNGRAVFVCCEGCEETIQDDPATYLAKLPKN